MNIRTLINNAIYEFLNENTNDVINYSELVEQLMNYIKNKYSVDFFIHYNKFSHTIILSKIVIDKINRNSGIGTNIMNEICLFADKHKMRIALTPSTAFGGSKSRLIQFYKRFGFKPYKGFEYYESMVRLPV